MPCVYAFVFACSKISILCSMNLWILIYWLLSKSKTPVKFIKASWKPSLQAYFKLVSPWNLNTTQLLGFRIHWLYPQQRGKTPTKKWCTRYDIKLHLIVRVQFWRSSGVWSTYSLPLRPGPLRPKLVVPVRVPFMGQIDVSKLLVFDRVQKKKKKKKNSLEKIAKNINMNVQWTTFSNP